MQTHAHTFMILVSGWFGSFSLLVTFCFVICMCLLCDWSVLTVYICFKCPHLCLCIVWSFPLLGFLLRLPELVSCSLHVAVLLLHVSLWV